MFLYPIIILFFIHNLAETYKEVTLLTWLPCLINKSGTMRNADSHFGIKITKSMNWSYSISRYVLYILITDIFVHICIYIPYYTISNDNIAKTIWESIILSHALLNL